MYTENSSIYHKKGDNIMNTIKKIIVLSASSLMILSGCNDQIDNNQVADSQDDIVMLEDMLGENDVTKVLSESKLEELAPEEPSSFGESRLVDPNNIKEDDFFVDVKWVRDKIEHDSNTVILEAGYGDDSYRKGHIADAVFMDTMEIETDESNWNILPVDESEQAFLDKGVTKDTSLVVYGEDVNAAARIAFVAYWLGVEDVKILDGGKQAWEEAGNQLDTNLVEGEKAEKFGVETPARPEVLIGDSEDLLEAKENNPELIVASIRSWEEYTGKTSGYDYIDNAGEIKDAVLALASTTAYDVNYFTNEDGTMRSPEKVFNYWEKWGLDKDKPIAFYCGTGWRNTTVFFVAKQSGFDNVYVQDGGWHDWNINHKEHPDKFPIQKGVPVDLVDNLNLENI